ncbi:MAG: hypothetical protein LUI05_09450 [Oscillospiraceae bacterium]|nr:hypothetical protein [Oscillospiraceae bacterium]
MIRNRMTEIIDERIRNCDELGDNWDYGINQCHEEAITILTQNIDETMAYFLNDCTDEEFYWLSEIFEEIIEKTQSQKLIQTLRNRLEKVTCETYCQQNFKTEHMQKWVDYAEYVRSVKSEIDYAEEKIED